jgi:hypothetical protein
MKSVVIGKLLLAGLASWAIGATAAEELSRGQVKTRLESAGFTNVRAIHREGDHFDAKATTKNGKDVMLDVNATTGAISTESAREEGREHRGNRH